MEINDYVVKGTVNQTNKSNAQRPSLSYLIQFINCENHEVWIVAYHLNDPNVPNTYVQKMFC